MTDDGDGGYVHDPEAMGGDAGETAEPLTVSEPPEDREFGWGGWVLVGVVVLCFLVIPGLILYVPATQGLSFLGVPYIHTLVALPMVPAVILGLVGVWLTTRNR